MTTRLTYAGDGYLTAFAVTFPYISPSHVRVFVNDTLQLSGMHYSLSGGSVVFNAPPGVDDVIVIQRVTSPLNALVDFTDGSTLKADELDTAYLHNFYLSQEYSDGFTKLIQDGHLYLAQPPLYRLAQGGKVFYARDDAHREELLKTEFASRGKVEISSSRI